MRLLLGGYTADAGGHASGIGMLLAGASDDASVGGTLSFVGEVAPADSPSWVTRHPSLDVVYAALEEVGAVQAYRRTGEARFSPLGPPVEAGQAACHIAVAPDGASLIASCWSDGRVVRMRLDDAGRPSAPVIAAAAVDPHDVDSRDPESLAAEPGGLDLAAAARALREAAGAEFAHLVPSHDADPRDAFAPASGARQSRAHQARFLSDGLIATTDMGFDLVRFWRTDGSGLKEVQRVVLPLGSGPRHMTMHPSGHLYVVAELSCEVFVLAPDASGTWRLVGGTPLGAGTLPEDTAAEIALSRDGEFVYAGVRGSNTIATLRVRGAGESLAPVALVESGVDWPRHHLVVRDIVLVAGERSDEVVSLTLDTRTGVPGRVRHRSEAPTPTCLVAMDR